MSGMPHLCMYTNFELGQTTTVAHDLRRITEVSDYVHKLFCRRAIGSLSFCSSPTRIGDVISK